MSAEANRLLLRHHLEKLRLPTIRREWEAVAASCARDRHDYGDFLLQLTERELIERAFVDRKELFEYWAHEASLVPMADWPLFRHRMETMRPWGAISGSRPNSLPRGCLTGPCPGVSIQR